MNDDPYLTEVLYAKIIDQEEILQRKCYSPASPVDQWEFNVFDQLSSIIFFSTSHKSISHELNSYYKRLIDSFLS